MGLSSTISTLIGGMIPSRKLYVGCFSTVLITAFCRSLALDVLRSRPFTLFGRGDETRSSGGLEAFVDKAFDTVSGIGGVGIGGGVGAWLVSTMFRG